MNRYRKNGFTLSELLTAVIVLGVVMLGTVGFTSGFMDVSRDHSQQLTNINQARSVSENIIKEISRAVYIYPSGITITLNDITINTNNSVAMLYKTELNGNVTYGFIAFFTDGTDLYQFTDYPDHSWAENTCPAEDMLSFEGGTTKLISDVDINNTQLSYILNYSNGLKDSNLLGQISGATTATPQAIIKGIDWKIAQNNVESQTVNIKELSRNVPRFYE